MKLTSALVGALLFVFGFSANAAIDNVATGNSSLILTIFDRIDGESIVVDTGLNIDDLVMRDAPASGATTVTPIDPGFSMNIDTLLTNAGLADTYASVFADNTNPIEWNLVAGDNLGNNSGQGTGYSILQTSEVDGAGTNLSLQQGLTNVQTFFNELGSANGFVSTSAAAVPNGGNPNWQENLGGASGGAFGDNTFLVGESMAALILYTSELFLGSFPSAAADLALTNLGFTAAFDGTTLSIGSVAPIPLPAAVWLFGAGLAGLIGFGRRNAATA